MTIEAGPSAGGGGGGAVTVADGADVALGTTTDPAYSGSGAGTAISLLKKIAAAGGSAVSIADGSDVAEGATTDAAVTTDANGTLSGKLRGLVKMFADMWDSANHRLNVAVQNTVTASVSGSVSVSNFPGTQAVSGTVTVQQSTGTNLHAVLDSGTLTGITNPITVSFSAAQHVIVDSGSVTVSGSTGRTWALSSGTDSVSVSGTVAVSNAGFSNTDNLTQVGGASISLGQKAMAASLPVVIASDQGAIPITGSISATSAATATAVPPAYTEGVSSALSQDLSGALRVGASTDLQRIEVLLQQHTVLLRGIYMSIGRMVAEGPADLRELDSDLTNVLQ